MRIAIVGSRDFSNLDLVYAYVEKIAAKYPQAIIISGGAKGVDRAAAEGAHSQNLKVIEHLPDWDRYGKSAGYKRNHQIIEDCEICVAFWNGSKGTQHSINIAKEQGKRVFIYNEQGELQ